MTSFYIIYPTLVFKCTENSLKVLPEETVKYGEVIA